MTGARAGSSTPWPASTTASPSPSATSRPGTTTPRPSMRLRAEAARLEQAKTTFLTLVNHELRTPLNGVLCALDLLDRLFRPRPRPFLDTALAFGARVEPGGPAILDFAGPRRGTGGSSTPVAFDLHDLIDHEAAAIAPAAAAKNLRWSTVWTERNVPRRLIGSPDAHPPDPSHPAGERRQVHGSRLGGIGPDLLPQLVALRFHLPGTWHPRQRRHGMLFAGDPRYGDRDRSEVPCQPFPGILPDGLVVEPAP